ncbi:MAG: hypothetical protein ACLFTA_03010, partial [Candidatus Nanohaloarchaea archaeon]
DSLDVSSSSVSSGDEITVSGNVINDNTGDPVEDADVELDLNSEDNSVSEDASTGEDGEFEVSINVEDAGMYDVEFTAEKNPYESFEESQSEAIEVFYDTGLSVSSESSPEVTLGEDYDVEYSVENTGQASAEDIEFDVSGVDESDYELSPESIDSLDAGDSQDVVLTLNLDEDLRSPPTISFEASGVSDGEDVEAGPDTTSVSFSEDVDLEGEESSNDSNSDSENSSDLGSTEDIARATGEFIESQSDMNLALGLILVFGVILAAAVRKRKEGGDDRMNGRMNGMNRPAGNGRVQKPDVSPQKVDPGKVKEDSGEPSTDSEASEDKESDESSEEEGEEESGDPDVFVCDSCGEEFDTESGLKLHRDALH